MQADLQVSAGSPHRPSLVGTSIAEALHKQPVVDTSLIRDTYPVEALFQAIDGYTGTWVEMLERTSLEFVAKFEPATSVLVLLPL